MKLKILIFILLFYTVTVFFSEIIIMKDNKVINGKIIKMDEDTITAITKTKEIIIDKEDVMKIYYSEKDYEEDRKKENNKAPYIVKVDPPNEAKNVISSRYKVWEITFNEEMRGGGFNYYFTYDLRITNAKWINNRKTYQIIFNAKLRPDTEYKIILNKTNEPRSDIQNMRGIYIKHDTIISFKTASVEMENKFFKIQAQAASDANIDTSKYVWLGVKIEDLDNKIKKELNIKPFIRGVIIKNITKNSPAEKAYLKKNDIIQSLFNEKIYTKEYFDFYINNLYFGSKIKLIIYRNGEVINQEIVLDVDK